MRTSSKRTTAAVLRSIIGVKDLEMAELLECSPATIHSVESGRLRLSEALAFRMRHETGISLAWLLAGDVKAAPVDERENPYTRADFDWHRAQIESRNYPTRTAMSPFVIAVEIVGIASAAGNKGRMSLFLWRLRKFLGECKEEFGFDDSARDSADAELRKTKLRNVLVHDEGFDFNDLRDKRLGAAISKAGKGKAPGEKFNVKVTLPPSKQSSRPSPAQAPKSARRPPASQARGSGRKQ